MLTSGRALVLWVHRGWVHVLAAQFSQQYYGQLEPDFFGLHVDCSRGYRLADIKSRNEAAVSVGAMLYYVDNTLTEEATAPGN